ncbi:unnamed protein product [Ranitomeya imitator]|uniref:Transducer of regulated CREB activity middle domain-containing protein n=1 Tax=Ranitomeya imitator TaxID=111125 RepID=A0ABN9L5M0_9NEOB|nr:unnamed protein product [Ranitomeya imitator]
MQRQGLEHNIRARACFDKALSQHGRSSLRAAPARIKRVIAPSELKAEDREDGAAQRWNGDSFFFPRNSAVKGQDGAVHGCGHYTINGAVLYSSATLHICLPLAPGQMIVVVPASLHEGEIDNFGEVFPFPNALTEESMLNVSKPMPKQLWEAKKAQSMASRPRSCEVPGIKVFPSSDPNAGLSHFQGNLNTGGSLPDLTNLHFPSPLPTPLDPDETTYGSMGAENSTGGLPAAMTHLGISGSPGLQNTRSNPSLQASNAEQ